MGNQQQFARVTMLIGILCVFAAPGVGQGSGPVSDSVTRGNWNALTGAPAATDAPESTLHWVEMPDGILLATQLWLPTTGGPTFPTVLVRTPYGRLGQPSMPREILLQEGYAVVTQDCRGMGISQGEFRVYDKAGPDGHATIEWIAQQSWSNGKVGMLGRSALGATQYAVAQGAPSALKCLAPAHESPDRYHHMAFPGGSLFYDLIYTWFHPLLADLYDELLQHRLLDSWWDDYDWMGDWIDAPETIDVPMFHMGRWYDLAQQGPLDAFRIVQHQGGAGAAGNQYLWMDPLDHYHDFGDPQDPHPPSPIPFEEFRQQLKLDWLAYWLKDEATGVDSWPQARIYVMGAIDEPGAPGNAWTEMDDWPPTAETRTLYLSEDGSLSESIPTPGQLTLPIDPLDPVLTHGGANYHEVKGPRDQAAYPVGRPIESRADVLTFTTDVLTEPTTVTGPVTAKIWINPDTPDLDLSVRLTDVYPDGRSMLIIDGIQRARMRCSDEYECFMTPGEPYEIEVDLWSTAMVFNAGHRIRVAIAGTNWERFERNSNDGGDLNNPNYIVANPEILFGPQYPTAILLPFPALFAVCTPIYVAAAAAGAGIGDSVWATDLGINNNSDEVLTYKFQMLPRGANNTDVPYTDEFNIQPNTNANFVNIWNLYTGGDGAGAINVCVSDPAAAGITSRTYNTSDAGTFGQAIVGMEGMTQAKLIGMGERVRLGFLTENGAFRTNVGFMSAGATTITIDAEFYTADGTSLGTSSIDIPPFSNNQWTKAFDRVTSDDVALGYIDVWSDTADAMFLTYGSVIDNNTDDPTTIWPFNTDEMVGGGTFSCTPYWIAAAASAAGAGDTLWATDLGLNNLGSDMLTYWFQFLPRGADNTGVALSDPFTLGGNQAIVYSDVWSMTGSQGAGAINVCVDNADAAGITSRTYNIGDAGTFGQMIEGMRGAAPAKVATGEKVRLGYLFENDTFRTNIGFMNAGANAITVMVEFFDMQGTSLGTKGVNLAPFSNTQWNKAYTLDPIFASGIIAGFADVWTDTPDADFLTYASIVDNGTGDPTTIWPF